MNFFQTEHTFSVTELILLSILPLLNILLVWLARNWRRIPDYWNLYRHRARAVSVWHHSISDGRKARERIVVPDRLGSFTIFGSTHVYAPEFARMHPRRGIPQIDVYQGDVFSGRHVLHIKDGNTYVVPEQQLLSNYRAQELNSFFGSNIVDHIAKATSREMRQLSMMYYMMAGALIAILLSMGLTWYLMDDLEGKLTEFVRTLYNAQGG